MSRVSAYSPKSPVPLGPRPASPVIEFQDRSSRQCSPASSVGSHASGISHPPGARKRRRITLENVFSSDLYKSVADWDDGQKSQPPLAYLSPDERALSGSLSSFSEESSPFTVEHPDLNPLMPLFPMDPPKLSRMISSRHENDYGSPIPFSSMVPVVIDRETGSRNQAKKRKANTDAAQSFRNRKIAFRNRKKTILRRRILHFMEQGRLTTEQRDFYRLERDFFRQELGWYVGTPQIPVRPASPYNYTSTMRHWSDYNPIRPDMIFSVYSQSHLALMTSSIQTKKLIANNDAAQTSRYRRSTCAELEQGVSFLMKQIQVIIEELDFYRSERAFFREELSRHVDAELCNDRSGTE